MPQDRLNAYHIMWLFVFFDLPVQAKNDRRAATRFRKNLLQDGFTMMQFSVYTRHCASKENADVHIKRVKSFVVGKGKISILTATDKQYSNIVNFWGRNSTPIPHAPSQLELF